MNPVCQITLDEKIDSLSTTELSYGQMNTALALLEEVDGLLALIESMPELPYAHCAAHQAALARHALETELERHALETELEQTIDVPTPLKILRTIANTITKVSFVAAVRSADIDLVLLLLETKTHVITETIVKIACKTGNLEIVCLLLDKDVKNNNVVFRWACEQNHVELVRKCLNVHINYGLLNYGLNIACLEEHIEIACMIIKLGIIHLGDDDNLLLQRACEKGHTEIVRQLLAMPLVHNGAMATEDINDRHLVNPAAQNNASLRAASERGHTEIVRLLLDLPLDCGVNPWQIITCEGEGDEGDEVCAFVHACTFGRTEIARLMLEHARRLERGQTNFILQNACTMACVSKNAEIIRVFLEFAPEFKQWVDKFEHARAQVRGLDV